MTVVIGIDPSLTGTGLANPITTTGTTTHTVSTTAATIARFSKIADGVRNVLAQARSLWPDDELFVVVEDLPTHAQGAGKTGMAQGVVRLVLEEEAVRYVTVTAATLKKFATGSGNADKHRMRMEAYKRAGVEFADDNQCDAWWLQQLGRHLVGDEHRLELPQTHTDALAKVVRPC